MGTGYDTALVFTWLPRGRHLYATAADFTSYIYCLFKCNVLIDSADHPLEILWPLCVACVDIGAIPGMTVTQRFEHCYYFEAGWSYNHHLPLRNSEAGFFLPFIAFPFLGCKTCHPLRGAACSLLHTYQQSLASYLLIQVFGILASSSTGRVDHKKDGSQRYCVPNRHVGLSGGYQRFQLKSKGKRQK